VDEREQVVRSFFSAIDAGAWDDALGHVTPEFTCTVTPNASLSELRIEGRDALRQWLDASAQGYEVQHRLDDVVHHGDQTVVLAQLAAHYAERSLLVPCVNVMRFEGSLIAENVMIVSD
jgi:ketosteroid isomerase-like protein